MSDPIGFRELSDLLHASAAGDQVAFATLYDRVSAKLFGVILRILNKRDLAEEALQETFVAIWQKADKYNADIASPIAWMATIARNKAIDKRRLKGERISDAAVELDSVLLTQSRTPLDDALSLEGVRRMQDCLHELPEERREMVRLAYEYGFSRDEIARRFGRPTATVKSIIRRAMTQLRGCIDGKE